MTTDPIAKLRQAGEKLRAKLRAEILALGSGAVAPLIQVLKEGDGDWPSIHTVDLLVDLRATQAIEPLLDALTEMTLDDIMFNRIVVRLPELGAAVVEPALVALETEQQNDDGDDDTIIGVCEILARLGIKDDRIFEALRRVFAKEADLGAGMLAQYGDPRALPLIDEAITEFEPDFTQTWTRSELVELVDAHERLGGVLAPEIRERVDAWFAEWDARQKPAFAVNAPIPKQKVGRNDTCPCGSGKKFKKCCLGSVEAAPPRVVAANGDRLHASGGTSAELVDVAAQFFREKDAGRGPAQQMADYAKPILDATDGDLESVQRAMNLAMLFWNLAIVRDDAERERALSEIVLRLEDTDRDEFEQTARMMIERHRAMFPEMHRTH